MKNLLKIHTLVIVMLLTLAMSIVYSQLYRLSRIIQLHPDERIFVNRGQFFDYYIEGDYANKIWRTYPSYDVPKFSELFYGLTLRLHSGLPVKTYLENTNFLYSEEHNNNFLLSVIHNTCCSIQDLPSHIQKIVAPILVARTSAVVLATLSIFLFILIGKIITNWIGGSILGIILFQNSLFRTTMVTAMGDAPLIFFTLLHFLLSLLFIKRILQNKTVNVLLLGLINISSGLALATKLNGGITLLFFLIIIFILFKYHFINFSNTIFLASISILINCVIFYVLNPFIWNSPIQSTIFMIQYRIHFMNQMQVDPTMTRFIFNDYSERIVRVLQKTIAPGGWHTNFSFVSNRIPIDAILFIIGFHYIHRSIFTVSYKTSIIFLISTIWVIILGLPILFILPMDFDHYYLFLVIALCFVEGLGLFYLSSNTAFWLHKKITYGK